MTSDFLWYIPNTVDSGHRGDHTEEGWGSLDFSVEQALAIEEHGFSGALIGTGWGRPDTFTVATAIAARTTRFKPLVAIRPGYWHAAHFAAAAATLDQLSGGRLLVNVVSGLDSPAEYGDSVTESVDRYARTREFMHLVKRLWTEDDVTFNGAYYQVEGSTVASRPSLAESGRYPPLYFGGASPAAEEVAAAEADVQLMWGEPLEDAAARIERLKQLSEQFDRPRALEFGLRITAVVRETREEAWEVAHQKLAAWGPATELKMWNRWVAVGQQRLLDLARRGEVLDTCLWTAPGTVGGGGAATTWLVGSGDEVAHALREYEQLGITHFVLSDTPYLREIQQHGELLLPRMHEPSGARQPSVGGDRSRVH